MKIIDISPLIRPQLNVWPGDTPFSRQVLSDLQKGDDFTLSSIQSTLHLGAHVDAPNHHLAAGADIASQPLDLYLGPCQVIEVGLPAGARIMPGDLDSAIEASRILFKTLSFPDPENWNDDFNSLSPELIRHLADRKVKLVGIDTPSVDPQLNTPSVDLQGSTASVDPQVNTPSVKPQAGTPSVNPDENTPYAAHAAAGEHSLAILEGLILIDVDPGHYILCALPLKIADADASPVRAVLMDPSA